MPTVMEKEQGENSSPGKTTAPAKQAVDRQNSLSPSGCPFHSGSASEQNGAGSHSEPQQNGSKPAPHGNEASVGSAGSTPPPTNGLYSPTSEVSDELNLKNESEDLETSPKDSKLPGRVGPPRKTRRSKKGGNEKDEKEDFRTISLKLLLPGQTDTIDIMHVAKDTVNDLLQYAFEKPDCCYRTCLSLRLRGRKLDNFSEIGSVSGLKDGSVIELVEEPYTLRDVMVHIQRLQELIGVDVLQSSYTCSNGLSLSFLNPIISTNLDAIPTDSKSSEPSDIPLPPDYIAPNSSTSASPPFISNFYPEKLAQYHQNYECLKRLSYSQWNPPTPNRKFKGDLLYIDVKMLEGEEFCITACPSGFYLNRSVPDVSFDPTPRKVAHHCQHLVTLLQQISALFRKNYSLLQKDGERKNVYEIFPVPYPVYPWLLPKQDVKPITFRTDECCGLKAATDELLVGQLRDWNEELQTTRELSSSTLQHRVFRDRALFKVQSDFVQAAIRGAKAAVDGQLYPLNPSELERNHMFLWNNIFFSTGFDGRGHFKDFGGDEAGHAAANYDLQGVSILEKLGIKGLHTLGAVLIDYRGYRVFAQTIVPGLLQREQDTSIVYGSMDNGKNFTRNEEFEKLLTQCGSKLHIRPHKILTESNEEVDIPVSVEVKGIDGTDGRHYVLDLFRILPPDPNYSCESNEGGEAASVTRNLRHKLYVLRPELMDHYLCAGQRLAMELHMFEEMKKTLSQQQKSEADKGGEADKEGVSNNETEVTSEGQNEPKADSPSKGGVVTNEEVQASLSPDKDMNMIAENELEQLNKDIDISLSSLGDADAVLNNVSIDHTQFPSLQALESSSPAIIILANEDDAGVEFEKTTPTSLSSLLGGQSNVEKPDLDEGGVAEKNEQEGKTNDKTDQSTTETTPTKFKDFDVLFNPDILTAGITHADSAEVLHKDNVNVNELSTYLTKNALPKFVRDCIYLNISPIDGTSLKSLLHSRGINIRYIGKIAMLAKTREDLDHIHRICVTEMILRTAKKRFRKLLLTTPLNRVSANVAHFLNCLLTDTEEIVSDEVAATTKKKSKKKKGGGGSGGGASGPVTKTTSAGKDLSQGKLWKLLVEDVLQHFLYTLEYNSVTHMCTTCGVSKVSLLREFCNKTGVQITLKDYKFSLTAPFSEDDIACIVPVVKHTDFKPLEASGLYELAQVQLQSGNIKVALDYLSEAVQLFAQVFGPLHVNIANCYKVIARIHHALGDSKLAISYQHKTVIMYERLLGVDHSSSISAYFHLAQYCCGAERNVVALRLLYRVRYLIMLTHGEDHPEMSNVDFYIGLLLSNAGHYEESQAYLESALRLQNKFHGSQSITVATTHHLLANSLTHIGAFAEAKQNERKAYNIYRTKFGPDHARTVQSYKDVRYITEKQVSYDQTIELALQGINKSKTSKGTKQ